MTSFQLVSPLAHNRAQMQAGPTSAFLDTVDITLQLAGAHCRQGGLDSATISTGSSSTFQPFSVSLAVSCIFGMDRRTNISPGSRDHHSEPIRRRYQRADRRLQPLPAGDTSRTDSLPQVQWAEIPNAFHPLQWEDQHLVQPVSMQQDIDSYPTGPTLARPLALPVLDTPRRRRRPRPLDEQRLARASDPTSLYPHTSSQGQPSVQSAPYQLEHFPGPVDLSVTFGLLDVPSNEPDPTFVSIPRTPAYPPGGGMRRYNSTSGASYAAFEDEEEFRLFVEATAGIGPVPTLDHSSPSPSPSRERDAGDHDVHHDIHARSQTLSSPIEQTPTTRQAFQHMAQMPESITSRYDRHVPNLAGSDVEQAWRQQYYGQRSAPPLWLPPPPHPPPPARWEDVNDISPIDDELPDYASSQAQAQASQRVEAARRAEELQRRWRDRVHNDRDWQYR